MGAAAGLSDSEILEHIGRQPHARAGYKQLVRELGARSFAARTELEQALARLAALGDLIEFGAGQYVVTSRSREFVTGRLQMHRDGYGFVVPDRAIEPLRGDVFIPPQAAAKAMHGDRVLVRIARIGSRRPGRGRDPAHPAPRPRHGGRRIPRAGQSQLRDPARRAHPAVDPDSRRPGASCAARRQRTAWVRSPSTPPRSPTWTA